MAIYKMKRYPGLSHFFIAAKITPKSTQTLLTSSLAAAKQQQSSASAGVWLQQKFLEKQPL